jgi:outer membrane protein assembly factor BamB
MGSFTMTPPGNGVGVVYAVTQDGSLHSMVKGSALESGTWPAPPTFPTWIPQSMNGPSQGRPSGIPVATDGSTRTIFLSSQDGHVYAFNAQTGATGWSPSSPNLAPSPNLQAHPSGVFSAFGGTRNLIFVGTHESAGSKFHALNLTNGTIAWTFDGTPFGRIGAISGQAAVDQQAKHVYFASRAAGPSPDDKTVWCVDYETGLACPGFTPQAYDDIDTGVSISGGVLFVGANSCGGGNPCVRAIRSSDGNQSWSYSIAIAGEGPPKGYVVVDRLTGDSYFSTAHFVWALDAGGGFKWTSPTLFAPSIPVYAPGDAFVYVGTGDGFLRRLRVSGLLQDTTAPFPIRLGDGTSGAGSPTFDLPNFMYVGTENGIVYAVQLP